MGVQGFFVSRSGIIISALAIFIIIPTLLLKSGVENWYTDLFANPFTSFAILFIIGLIAMHRYIRGNVVVATLITAGIALLSYLYVYALIL